MPLYRLTEAQAAEVRFILTVYAPPPELREWKRRLRVQEAALRNLQKPVKQKAARLRAREEAAALRA